MNDPEIHATIERLVAYASFQGISVHEALGKLGEIADIQPAAKKKLAAFADLGSARHVTFRSVMPSRNKTNGVRGGKSRQNAGQTKPTLSAEEVEERIATIQTL